MQMTQQSIDAFLESQIENGASKDAFRQGRGFVTYLYQWLPENKELSKECLKLWREDMERKGYTQQTILNYVKGINNLGTYSNNEDASKARARAKELVMEDAIAARMDAEKKLNEDPQAFLMEQGQAKELCV